jgi:NCAIR mutase (PurE)-related protein
MPDEQTLRAMLEQVARRELTIDAALATLRDTPYDVEDLGFARIDHHRALRRGHPEVVYCAGKSPDQVAAIFARMAAAAPRVLGTRATPEHAAAARSALGDAVHYDPAGKTLWIDRDAGRHRIPGTVILAAGTSDLPIAEEAAVTLDLLGYSARRVYDVGVAGLHRLLSQLETLRAADVLIVVAGMEGALPSVVAGLVAVPVVAVPTSVGYGASFGGLAALLGMLNSCSPGIAVVNIDNGFGAAYLAASILDVRHRPRPGNGEPEAV